MKSNFSTLEIFPKNHSKIHYTDIAEFLQGTKGVQNRDKSG